MESFSNNGSNENQQQQEPQKPNLTFNVGDRVYDESSATTKIEHADRHINTLLAEKEAQSKRIAELEASVAQATKLDEALSRINTPTEQPSITENPPVMDVDSLKSELLSQLKGEIQEQERARDIAKKEAVQKANFEKVSEVLISQYGGDQVDNVVAEKAKSLGIEMTMAKDLAMNNPEFFLNTFGNGKSGFNAPSQSQKVNSHGLDSQIKTQNLQKSLDDAVAGIVSNKGSRVGNLNDALSSIEQLMTKEELRAKWRKDD